MNRKEITLKTHIDWSLDKENHILSMAIKTEDGLNSTIKQHCTEVINFKDEKIKESLIKLGWTPPEEKLKPIPFSNPDDNGFKNVVKIIKEKLTRGSAYPSIRWAVERIGYYLPEDQYNNYVKLITEELKLSVGNRVKELTVK